MKAICHKNSSCWSFSSFCLCFDFFISNKDVDLYNVYFQVSTMYTMSAIVNSFMLPLIVNNHSTEQQFPNQTLSTASFHFLLLLPQQGRKVLFKHVCPCHISTKCSNFCACLLTLWCSPPMMIMQDVTYFSNINQAKTTQLNLTHPPHDSRKGGTRTISTDSPMPVYTHTRRLMALFPGLPGWAGTRKVKTIWILLKQETVSGRGISWAICKSAPRSRQITKPAPHHSVFTGRMPFLPPNQQCQSTEGKSPMPVFNHETFSNSSE